MVELGVRMQFYDQMRPDGVHSGYVGSVVSEKGFRAVAVPAVGDLLAAASLHLPTKAHPPTVQFNPGIGPFLRVQAVEHHPIPVRDGASPTWWEGIGGPRVTVVLHTTLSWRVDGADSHAQAQLRAFLRGFADAGWDGMFTGDGVLPRIWRELELELCR